MRIPFLPLANSKQPGGSLIKGALKAGFGVGLLVLVLGSLPTWAWPLLPLAAYLWDWSDV
ncbi:hypothetical protein SAMN06265795_104257 [Noviherbaspirillum humi]|uniref:Uncharacterized protein n=1 Tax=Noviherbaspirillum humi TaxID=1688639 RepID=A0A239G6K2_9BURK|nr:hypothetical protein [Noviherbaspirillum humi]SNS64302.1 hypothetical protein SAMN06265795_104257 [Noviherbaspirillum humi]